MSIYSVIFVVYHIVYIITAASGILKYCCAEGQQYSRALQGATPFPWSNFLVAYSHPLHSCGLGSGVNREGVGLSYRITRERQANHSVTLDLARLGPGIGEPRHTHKHRQKERLFTALY